VTVIVLCVAVTGAGMAGSRHLSKRSRYIAEEILPSLVHMAMANQFHGQAFQHLVCAVNAKDVGRLRVEEAEVRSYSEMSQKELGLFEKSDDVDKHRELFKDFLADRETYLKTRNKILLLCDAGNRIEAMNEMMESLLPMYDRYLDKSQELMEHLSNDGIVEAQAIGSVSAWVQVFTMLSSILIFFFGFILGYTR